MLNKITFLSRIKKYISFLFIIIFSIQFVRAEDWTSAQLKGKGEITVYYYNSDNFISDASGNLSGIEYDILIAFKDYLEAKGIDITLKFKKADSFSGLYNKIKNGDEGNFGACSFSMTEQRMKEVSFSPKYMPDIEVLINSKNVAIAKNKKEFLEIFSTLTALSVSNTTFEEDLIKLKEEVPDFKIQPVKSASIIRERILSESDLFGYIELPTYLKLFKEGIRFKRQNLYKVERYGYGIILPKNSTWLLPISEFFYSNEFKTTVNQIIKKHLGDGVNELLWRIESQENGFDQSEISLLTMEREAQEMEIEQQALRVQMLIGGVAFVLIVVFFLFYSYRLKKSANKSLIGRNNLIEKQKIELERLSIVAEKMNEAVVITDSSGKVEYYNYSLVRNSGYTEKEFKEHFKESMHLVKLSNRDDIIDIIKGFETNAEPYFYDSSHEQKDGRVMWTTASLSPVYDSDKKLSKIIVVYTDISERKEFANQLEVKNKEITDSINYAKMIQDAMLPSESVLGNVLTNIFYSLNLKTLLVAIFIGLNK